MNTEGILGMRSVFGAAEAANKSAILCLFMV